MRVAQIDGEAEAYYSLQGEGTRAGEPAVFLRLAGCNRRCTWCDTKYSWETGLELTEEEVARRMLAFDCRHFVITGGEPLLQTEKLENLCSWHSGTFTHPGSKGEPMECVTQVTAFRK